MHREQLPYTSFQGYRKEFLRLNGKFHGEFVNHFLGITVHDEVNGALNGYTALLAVEKLILRDF
jgi:hypothetical protein